MKENHEDFEDNSFRKKHFAKIHEKVQNKYNQMQLKLEKSRSIDSLSTLKENDIVYETRYASNYDIRESEEFSHIENRKTEKTYDKQSISIENISRNDASIKYFDYREANISDSESEFTPNEKHDANSANRFFGNTFSKTSLESLNEVAGESDGYLTPTPPTPSPPPRISIRNKIGSRITAAREKRRVEKEKDKKKEYSNKVEKLLLSNTTKQDVKIFKKLRVATVTIALIEATGFETENNEDKNRILFCRFRLGNEKYKSKLIKSNSTAQFKWQELFNFNLYDENILEISLWDKDIIIGRSFLDLYELDKEKTHRKRITLESEDRSVQNVQIFILLTISGLSLVNTLVDLDDYKETQRRLSTVRKRFAWYHFNSFGEIGWVSVIVYGAKGLSGNDCYCILELDNERRQTYTEPKTADPNWMKIFNFTVTDITSVLEVTVYDEKKSEDVGKLSIPLLNVNKFEKKWYPLKDSSQRDRAKGTNPRILLEIKITWNILGAAVRVINPKEIKFIEPEEKLDRHTFSRSLSRAKAVITWVISAINVIKTCFEWESRKSNVISLTIWLIFCWFFKLWMLPLLLLIPFAIYRPRKYYLINWKENILYGSEVEENADKKEEKNTSLRQKIQSLQEMVQSVQVYIGKFANLGESIKNLFNFTVPFLSFLTIFFIVVITFIMYIVPINYIFMIWGIHKFTRKILRPNRIPNNEVLDLLSRVPDDETLLNYVELPLENIPEEDVIK